MYYIRPSPVTDAVLLSSSVPETDHAVWAAGTTYAAGVRVIYGHRIWQSAQAGNTGKTPGTDVARWSDQGPTNRWAMFDDENGTQTIAAGAELTVTLACARCRSLALLAVQADSVEVTIRKAGAVLHSSAHQLTERVVADWVGYVITPPRRRRSLLLPELTLLADVELTVTLRGTVAEPPRIGLLAFGQRTWLSHVEWKPSYGIADFSRIETDSATGVRKFRRGAYARRVSGQLVFETAWFDELAYQLSELRATPVVWVLIDGFDAFVVFGTFERFDLDLPGPSLSYGSLELLGNI